MKSTTVEEASGQKMKFISHKTQTTKNAVPSVSVVNVRNGRSKLIHAEPTKNEKNDATEKEPFERWILLFALIF